MQKGWLEWWNCVVVLCGKKLRNCVVTERWVFPPVIGCREAQAFVEKFEGALGKGKGRKLYAYKVMMAKVRSTVGLGCGETHPPTPWDWDHHVHGREARALRRWLFFLYAHRNSSNSSATLRTSKQLVSPGRGRSRRWKVRKQNYLMTKRFRTNACVNILEAQYSNTTSAC